MGTISYQSCDWFSFELRVAGVARTQTPEYKNVASESLQWNDRFVQPRPSAMSQPPAGHTAIVITTCRGQVSINYADQTHSIKYIDCTRCNCGNIGRASRLQSFLVSAYNDHREINGRQIRGQSSRKRISTIQNANKRKRTKTFLVMLLLTTLIL